MISPRRSTVVCATAYRHGAYQGCTALVCVLSFCGTEAYLAPEMILRLPYGASVDFWQYGCFVYELYAGRSPFWLPRKPRKFIRENILNGVFAYPSVVPEPAKGITGALLQVLGHNYFAEFMTWYQVRGRLVFHLHLEFAAMQDFC